MQPQLFYEQLVSGKGYLIYEDDKDHIQYLLPSIKHNFCNCLLLTRNNINNFKEIFQSPTICNYKTVKINTGNTSVSNQRDVDYVIQDFCSNNNKSIIILDRTDYLLKKYSFYHFMNTIYFIHDIIIETNSILLVFIHKNLLNETENILLQKELNIIKKPKLDLNKNLFDILEIVHFQNEHNRLIDHKTLKNKLHLTYPTIRKRLKQLEQNELIETEMNGRCKNINITEKGKLALKP